MLLKHSILKRFIRNEALEHIEDGGPNWCLPSPTRSKLASSCRLVGHAPDGRVLIVLETLTESSAVLSEIYLQSVSSSSNSVVQRSTPIFRILAAAIVYHCALSPGSGSFLLVTFVSVTSPFTNQPVKRSRRLHDTILVHLSVQDYHTNRSCPSFAVGCDVESTMRVHGIKSLASGTPDPLIGYFLSSEQESTQDNASSTLSPCHPFVLQIDNVTITMQKLSISYFLVSHALGAILDEYILPFTRCTCCSPTNTSLSRTTIEQINIRFNQEFTDRVESFVIWHKARHLGTLFSYMREPVAFKHFLPTTGDLVVVTKQRVASQMPSIGVANLTISIYKESRASVNQLSHLNTAQPGNLSASQASIPSVQILRHITSICVGPFPDYPLTVAEAFSALIPRTIGVSFGSVSSTIPVVGFEHFHPSAVPTDLKMNGTTSTVIMLTLVSPFTEAVYNTAMQIDADMDGLRMTGRDEDKIETGIRKHADATNFRLFSAAISSHILHSLSPAELGSTPLLDPLMFKVVVRNSYRHSFFSICSTQLFFTSNLVIWIVPDPVTNAAKTTLISCSQAGGFNTVFAGSNTLLSVDMMTLFNAGVIRRISTSIYTGSDEVDSNVYPNSEDPIRSSLFDVLCTAPYADDSFLPTISDSSSDTLIYQSRRILHYVTECFVTRSTFRPKSKCSSQDTSTMTLEHDVRSFDRVGSLNDPDFASGSVSSQIMSRDTKLLEGCTVTGLFSELTHLIPVTAEKVAYVTILKELDLHRSGTLLDCSSKRFLQLPTIAQGIYACDCAFLDHRHCENEVLAENLWASRCMEVRKRFQTVYLYDTYLCRLLAVEINYSAILDQFVSEKQRSYLHDTIQKTRLLMSINTTLEANNPSMENFISSISLQMDRFLLNILLSVQIYSFFYFLSTLVFDSNTCPAQAYIASNVIADTLGSTSLVLSDHREADLFHSFTQPQLIDQLFRVLLQSGSLFTSNVPSIALSYESPLVLFSVLYLCSLHTDALNDYDWLSKQLACSAFAACYYRKLMRKNILVFRSIRQFYKAVQPISSMLDAQFSHLQSFAQMDELSLQVSDTLLKDVPDLFNPRVLSIGRLENTTYLHPLSKHIVHTSSVYSCLRDYYIYHRSSARDWPRQIKLLRCHSLQQVAGTLDAYIVEMDTLAFTRQVGDCLAKIQTRMYQVTAQAFTAAPTLWIPLLEVYEEFMGYTYSSSKARYPGIPDTLWNCACDYLEGLGGIPYRLAWVKEPDPIPQYLYPCYRYTSNYLEHVSKQVLGSTRGQSFKRPLSNILSLLLEHSALQLAILQEERSSHPTFLRLLDLSNVPSSESQSESRSRSRSKLGRQQTYHSEDLTIEILDVCPKKFLEAAQKRLTYIEGQFDQPLLDISALASMELLEFELAYGPVIPDSSRLNLVASVIQRSDSFTSISTMSSRPGSRASSRAFRRESQMRAPNQPRPLDSLGKVDQSRHITSNNHSDLYVHVESPVSNSIGTSFTIRQVHECDGLDRNDLASFLKYL